jgi:periplasmic protein TonB
VIGKDGRVRKLRTLSGDPMLAAAATKAAKKWRYEPTRLNGQPVEVVTEIDVTFTLSP